MNTQVADTQQDSIAIATVARYAGISVQNVRATLHRHRRDAGRPRVEELGFSNRNRHAIHTTAAFSGVDEAEVARTLEGHAMGMDDFEAARTTLAA